MRSRYTIGQAACSLEFTKKSTILLANIDIANLLQPTAWVWNECRLQRHAFLRAHPNSFMDEVCAEAMAEGDAGNRSARLGTLLNHLGLEGFGVGAALWLHEIPA